MVIMITGTGCREILGKRVRGNGNIKSETRTSVAVNKVDVSGNIDVYVREDSTSGIRVEADENLLEYIVANNDGGVLRIHERRGYNLRPSRGVKVYVFGPDISNFEASGACDIFSENQITSSSAIDIDLSGASNVNLDVNAPGVDASLSGAGTVSLKGQTRDLKLVGSGSSDFNCLDLMAENVTVRISGAGNADVNASVRLDVRVSGAGEVRYKGNAMVDQKVTGAGSVKKIQ